MIRKVVCHILFILFVLTSIVFSQDENSNVKINFKAGNILNSKIIGVKPWGLELEENQTLSYGVIKNLELFEQHFIDSIAIYVKDLEIVQEGDLYLVNFTNAEIPKFEVKKNNVLTNKYFFLNFMSNRAENFEFSFNFSVKEFENFIMQIAFSTGRYSPDETYSVNAYTIGLGIQIPIKFGQLTNSIHYGVKNLSISDGRYISPIFINYGSEESVYINSRYKNDYNETFIYGVGIRYYLENITIKKVTTRFSFNLGIGIKF